MTKPVNKGASLLKTGRDVEEVRVVAVGASAGGLEALKSFFKNAPENDKNAYVVIQHLSPDHKSMMGELLRRSTKLPVVEISEALEPMAGHIYLVPPANNLILEKRRFRLSEKPKESLNLPIDKFFESLASERKEKAIGVILSGTGSDGTRGARAIKENGGMVMVQDPKQAQFNGMPQSSINTGLVDYVLPVEDMVTELHNFITSPSLFGMDDDDVDYDENGLKKILHLVNQKTGLDFSDYKYSTLVRRVARRLHVCKCESLEDYHSYLQEEEDEVEILYHEFLIGVTKFFRDRKVWALLMNKVIPEMVRQKEEGDTIKLWDVGCSTGEEAYSFAMCFFEEMERQQKSLKLKIFATDISKKHLEVGGRGRYPDSIAADVPQEYLVKYFVRSSHSFRVVEKLRNSVIFSRHNVIENPPFSNMDMVVCRNMLIYFQQPLKDKTLKVLHYALQDNGILVLGTSESLNGQSDKFAVIDRKWKIFQNINPGKGLNVSVSPFPRKNFMKSNKIRTPEVQQPASVKKKMGNELQENILEVFGGASVLIDKDYNILKAVGEFRKYANLPVTGFSTNLLEMMDSELKYILQNILSKAQKENEKIYYKEAVYQHNGMPKAVDVIANPFRQPHLDRGTSFVVTFIERELQIDPAQVIGSIDLSEHTKEYVSTLEEELKQTKEELQNSLQEIETSNEELQAANEELLASNEELQSTNEELQSVNEEINTVNAENIQKMDDLVALYTDMNNLLESTQIGTIFLDSSLSIRKFTPAIKEHFSFLNSDLGRPISHFTGNIGRNNLVMRCKRVLETGKTLEKAVITSRGKHYLRRISPYINSEQKIDGVVITFIDIESLEKSRLKLAASEKRFKAIYEDDPVMHISVDPKSAEIIHCNAMTLEKLGYGHKDELVGQSILDLYHNKTEGKSLLAHEDFKKKGQLINLERELLTKDKKVLPVILNATAELDEEDNIRTIRYTCVDISAQKKAEEQLMRQKADLERANRDLEQFVSICSHDLQEPLSTIKFGSDVLNKLYGKKLDKKGQDYLSYIDQASTRLSTQIKALLEHSRIGRNGKKTLVNMKEVVEVVKYDLGKRIKDTGAKIHVGTLPKLMAYEVEMRLLFQNLISNAIKYTPEDRSPEVRISAFKEEDSWIFSVMDNGVGIKKKDLKNIFTIFNRVEDQEKKDGTGVGLAHVEKIVWLHEGSVWVDSQEGVGSTFYFKIKG